MTEPGDRGRSAADPGTTVPAPAVRVDVTVTGRVQGVGYRWFAVREATALGLRGWVANQPDGTVRCVAEGDRAALDRLLRRLEAGPSGARVDGVTTAWGTATGTDAGFTIRSGGHSGD